MRNNRVDELIEPRALRRSASYIKSELSYTDANELARAYRDEDKSKMANILKRNSSEPFLGRLFDVAGYDAFTIEMAREQLDRNRDKLAEDFKPKAQAGVYKPSVVVPKEVYYAPVKPIQQKQKGTGKIYTRASPRAFSRAETNFIARNPQFSQKQLVANFGNYFPQRSASSILTKKYRIHPEKK